MNKKSCTSKWLSFSLLFIALSSSANSDIQQWMEQQAAGMQAQKKEFQEYKDNRDKEFTSFLKAQWKAVDIVKGEIRDKAPKPDVMPVAPDRPVKKAPARYSRPAPLQLHPP